MKRSALFTVVFCLVASFLTVSLVLAQAKPSPAKKAAEAAIKTGAKDAIRLGAIYDFAGPCYMYSESAVNGIRIAMEEINAKGGILGRKLDLIVRDTEAKVDVGARETKDLILGRRSIFCWGRAAAGCLWPCRWSIPKTRS